jgi:hypothetical protein
MLAHQTPNSKLEINLQVNSRSARDISYFAAKGVWILFLQLLLRRLWSSSNAIEAVFVGTAFGDSVL